MTAPSTFLQETTDNQRRAADPARSVFVMANAGSGKTRVLTNRVARLLLSGAEPQKILCITFTKAGAAEMAERLFSVLGEWALASDDDLIKALAELEGSAAPEKSAKDLSKARRLFAKALETPGGLKIQTIHSFCESVLRRFPIEAGTPPGFSVLEDGQGAVLLNDALDRLASAANADTQIGADFDRLSLKRGEAQLRELLIAGAQRGDRSGGAEGIDEALAGLAQKLDVDPSKRADDLKAGFAAGLVESELKRAHDGLAMEGAEPQKAAARLAPYFSAETPSQKWDALLAFLLTDKGAPRKNIASKATDKHDPWVRDFANRLKERFFDEVQRLKALALFKDTAAHLRLTSALVALYNNAKSARATLDFDDLIARTRGLFANTQSAWIMYKLDYGIDHILIDEAQDTSPDQWAVIEGLFTDYLSGVGAREEPRSFFAVGDLKQSIYSFQGADVGLFKEKEQSLGQRLAAITDYANLPLTLSFRTTAPVLSFVDAVFEDRAAAEGLGDEALAHGVFREGEAGLVELWPLTPRPETLTVNPWDAPVDTAESDHPVRVLCERVATMIAAWLRDGERLVSRDRPVRAGDIMILVQSRGALFREVIQRLSSAGVPVAGPDRLKLIEDPAVEDLLSYARFALYQNDDLSLAEILKSPLFGFDDDADLFPLAHERRDGESLWASLNRRAGEKEMWGIAAQEIAAARAIARGQGPYAFFSQVLEMGAGSKGDGSGRRRFFARFGEASSDAVDELLRQAIDFENANPRSLREFVSWFEGTAGDIKRELEREHDAVRVMTVHGAKGLEADVVFLLDAHRELNTKNIGPLIDLPVTDSDEHQAPHGLSLLAWSKADDVPLSEAARDEKTRAQYEEYRRLFYVAATRARDRLYICGVEQGNNRDPQGKPVGVKSWHALACDGFERLGGAVDADDAPLWAGGEGRVMRLQNNQSAPITPTTDDSALLAAAPAPSWLHEPAAQETAPTRLAPSRLTGEEAVDDEWAHESDGEDAAYSPVNNADRYFRGRTLHRLLELLPQAPKGARAKTADALLARLAPGETASTRAQWRDEVSAVLDNPQFAAVFAPGSLAETPIAGRPKGAPSGMIINGQIDRLVVTSDQVLAVDYKTNRPPPSDIAAADPAYIAQMAAYRALLQEIYPGRQVCCALLWTYDLRLMAIPDEMLDHAFARTLKMG